MPAAGNVSLKIYDIAGREMAVLADEFIAAGTYTARWNASSFASGTYIVRMTAGKFSASKKMTLVR